MQKNDLAVITIISRKGSVPRLPGTRMLITADGRRFGTVGGGFFEADAVRAGEEILSSHKSRILEYTSVPGSALPDDIICGGSLEILVEYLPADPYHRQLIGDFVALQKERTMPVMVVPLPGTSGDVPARFFIRPDGSVCGAPPRNPASHVKEAVRTMNRPGIISTGGSNFLVEPCPPQTRLVLGGAGHIAAEAAPLAAHLGFEVTVLDDRAEFLDQDVFLAVERVTVASYDTCFQTILVDSSTGILIATRSHNFDLAVLRQALRTNAGYIGMIGSRHKWKTLSSVLLNEGFGDDDLKRVHCPAGLEIGADSPEEIAISIMAELVRYRSEPQ